MSKAIIYYSLSGRTKRELENRFDGDFYRLKGKIKIPKRYFVQMFYLGYFATFNKDLDYEKFDIDFSQYDEIVLASPVWAFTFSPFMKKFLKDNPIKNKNITLLMTHEGGPGKSMEKFKKYLDDSNTVVDEISLQLGSAYKEAKLLRKSKKTKN